MADSTQRQTRAWPPERAAAALAATAKAAAEEKSRVAAQARTKAAAIVKARLAATAQAKAAATAAATARATSAAVAKAKAAAAVRKRAASVPVPLVGVYYKNCTAARAAGAAPVHRGDPGYASHLDRDNDGVGCE